MGARLMRRLCAALLMSILVLALSACAGSAKTPDGAWLTFTDDAGQEIRLDKKPERVAVLFSSFAEIWTLSGGEVAVTVGESVERGFAGGDALLVDSGAGKTINEERLLSCRPDFVICSADIPAQVSAAELLNTAGIPAAVFRVESFADYLRVLSVCTQITGNAEAYETYGASVKREIDGLLSGAADETQMKILFIRAGSSARSTKAKTAEEHFACAMLRELGTYNIAENARVLLDGLSIEEILTENPDYIFISTMGNEAAARRYMDSVLADSTWQSLDAVKAGRYAYLPKELFQFKPNARWAQAYRYLREILYGKE